MQRARIVKALAYKQRDFEETGADWLRETVLALSELNTYEAEQVKAAARG